MHSKISSQNIYNLYNIVYLQGSVQNLISIIVLDLNKLKLLKIM
jgi:hypothetical protein